MDSPSTRIPGDPAAETLAAKAAERFAPRAGAQPVGDSATAEPVESGKGPVAIERLWEDLRSLRRSFELLYKVRRDQVIASLRRAFFFGIAIGIAIFASAVLAGTACVLLVIGVAGGIAEWLGGRVWLGQLLTGCGLIAGGSLLGFVLFRVAKQRFRRKTLERYGKVER
jgi:hypothetical protein